MKTTQHPTILNRLNDIFFKYLLGSEERKNYTLNFLNTTLDLSGEAMFSDLTFADKEKVPQVPAGRSAILDILAITNTGTRVNIEVQVCKDRYMAERALYYWSRIYGGQLQKKESYDKLNKVISIILMDFDFFEQYKAEFHQLYHITNDVHPQDRLIDHFEMHFIELEKIHYSDIKKLKRSDRWIAYLAKKTSDNDRKELAKMDSILKDVAESEDKFVSDLQLWREYEAKEKAIKDEQSHLLTAIQEGEAKEKRKTVQRLLSLGVNLKTIAAGTDLTIEEVQKIINEIKPR